VLLVTRLAIFPDAIGTAFYPLLSKSKSANQNVSRRHALLGIALAVVTCTAVALPTMFVSGWISHILFPKSPIQCQHVITLTIWALPLFGIEQMMGYTANAAGMEARQARATFFSTLASLTFGAILVFEWKLEGACWYMLARSFIQICLNLPVFLAAISRHPRGRSAPPVPSAIDPIAIGVHQ